MRFFKLFPTDADFYRYFINGRRKKYHDFILHGRKRLVTKRDIALEKLGARGSIRGMFRLLEVSNGERSNICQTGQAVSRTTLFSPFRPPARARARLYIYFLIIDTNPTTDYVLWVDERLTVGLMKFHTGTPAFLTYADFASCRINMLLIVNTGFTGGLRYGAADFAIAAARVYSGITALPRVNKINFCADYSP